MSADRYFYKIDNRNDIKVIYRLLIDDVQKKITELVWLNGKWQKTDTLVGQIMGGEFELEEVSKEEVQIFTPYVDTTKYQLEK
jgi:hypothetical protein